ncbi:MAG: 5-oxoprolinase subunit PxpA [Planctomycetota bacterium]
MNQAGQIDINCDVGESYGAFVVGNDAQVLPLIDSANIACGFHGGDPSTMQRTIELAIEHDVQIGAHPCATRDLEGFGRRPVSIPSHELDSNLKYQIGALQSIAQLHGTQVSYVKPHGALYHQIQRDESIAQVFVQAVMHLNRSFKILAADGAILQRVCAASGAELIPEGFADRRYQPNGQLVSRIESDAVIRDPELAAEQACRLAADQATIAVDGSTIEVHCRSICVHGDQANATEILKAINRRFGEAGIQRVPFC